MSVWHDQDLQKCISFNVEQNKWDGDCDDYWRGNVNSAALGIFIACVIIVFLIFYLVARLCGFVRCVCMGCRVSQTGSTLSVVKSYRACLCAVWVALLLLGGLASHKRARLYDGVKRVNTVVDDVRIATENHVDMVANGSNSIGQLPGMYNATLEGSVNHTQDKVHKWSHDIKDIKDGWTDSLWVIDLVIWVPAAFFVVYLVTALLNLHYVVPVVTFCFFVIFALAGAGLQGVLGMSSTFVTDACDNFEGVNSSTTAFFASSKYLDNSHVALMRSVHSSVEMQYTEYQCNNMSSALQTLCATGVFSCPLECATGVAAYIAHTTLNASLPHGDCEGSCSIAQCATSCPTGSQWHALSQDVMQLQDGVQDGLQEIDAGATPLVSASIFEQGIVDVHPFVCDGSGSIEHRLKPAVHVVNGAAFFVMIATILTCLGTYLYIGTVAEDEERPLVYIAGADVPVYTQQPTVATVAPTYYPQNVNAKPDPVV